MSHRLNSLAVWGLSFVCTPAIPVARAQPAFQAILLDGDTLPQFPPGACLTGPFRAAFNGKAEAAVVADLAEGSNRRQVLIAPSAGGLAPVAFAGDPAPGGQPGQIMVAFNRLGSSVGHVLTHVTLTTPGPGTNWYVWNGQTFAPLLKVGTSDPVPYLRLDEKPLQISDAGRVLIVGDRQQGLVEEHGIWVGQAGAWERMVAAGRRLPLFPNYGMASLVWPDAEPLLTAGGTLAFRAIGAPSWIIYAHDAAGWRIVARAGSQVPGFPAGQVWGKLGIFRMDGQGRVAFVAAQPSIGGGIWGEYPDGLRLIVSSQSQVPGTPPGTRFSGMIPEAFARGRVLFVGFYLEESMSVKGYYWADGNTIQPVVTQGAPDPAGGTFNPATQSYTWLLNDADQLVMTRTATPTPPSPSAVYYCSWGQPLSVLYQSGTPIEIRPQDVRTFTEASAGAAFTRSGVVGIQAKEGVFTSTLPGLDPDGDGVPSTSDNCPDIANCSQLDQDSDGIGDACDNCPQTSNVRQDDIDADGLGNACDSDQDSDGIINASDNCPLLASPDQTDDDGDGCGNACDVCPATNQGLAVDANGCPPLIDADLNGDGDVDQSDFGTLQSCLGSGPKTSCAWTDINVNGSAGENDVRLLIPCIRGANLPADPDCLPYE